MKIHEIEEPINPGQKQQFDDSSNIDKYTSLIRKNCSDALSAMIETQKFLYRGYAFPQPLAFKGRSRNDRRPLSFDVQTQKMLDSMLANNGFEAIRSNSIYVTSQHTEAEFYTGYAPPGQGKNKDSDSGNVYYVFPINGFKFTWAMKTSDLYGDFTETDRSWLKSPDPIYRDKLIEKYGITNENFAGAVQSGNEILIHGEYYAFNVREFGGIFNRDFFEYS